MRQWLPSAVPECVKYLYPKITWTYVGLFIVIMMVFAISDEVYNLDPYARYSMTALFVFASLYFFLNLVKATVAVNRLIRRAVDERFELCCACGYPIPPGAEECPECGAAWDPDEAHKSWKAAADWRYRRGRSVKENQDSAS